MMSINVGKLQSFLLSTAILGGLMMASRPAAANVVTPADAPHVVSPPFGPVAPGGLIDDEYVALGIRFSTIPANAIFDDTDPLAWAGVNGSGDVDLLSDVVGRFELPGGILAQTNFISVEGGFAEPGNLLLLVFNAHGQLLGTTTNDDGIGPHGRTLMTLNIPGIHEFVVHTPGPSGNTDNFGVDQIEFNELTPVPEPATLSLLALGLPGLLAARRRKRA